MLKQKQVTIGIILPYIWTFVFACLIIISFISRTISFFISAENLILLTFICSPFIYITGIVISFVTMLTSGRSRKVLFAIGFNIVLLSLWFVFRKPFYIEFNIIS
ncbi:MAG: hypothetical protein JW787_12535 [Sedimentisphaerales bacterium]|nr:hypothetical protein [Sedimentisphaerales bacterium]